VRRPGRDFRNAASTSDIPWSPRIRAAARPRLIRFVEAATTAIDRVATSAGLRAVIP
jgi:hypothetical protein